MSDSDKEQNIFSEFYFRWRDNANNLAEDDYVFELLGDDSIFSADFINAFDWISAFIKNPDLQTIQQNLEIDDEHPPTIELFRVVFFPKVTKDTENRDIEYDEKNTGYDTISSVKEYPTWWEETQNVPETFLNTFLVTRDVFLALTFTTDKEFEETQNINNALADLETAIVNNKTKVEKFEVAVSTPDISSTESSETTTPTKKEEKQSVQEEQTTVEIPVTEKRTGKRFFGRFRSSFDEPKTKEEESVDEENDDDEEEQVDESETEGNDDDEEEVAEDDEQYELEEQQFYEPEPEPVEEEETEQVSERRVSYRQKQGVFPNKDRSQMKKLMNKYAYGNPMLWRKTPVSKQDPEYNLISKMNKKNNIKYCFAALMLYSLRILRKIVKFWIYCAFKEQRQKWVKEYFIENSSDAMLRSLFKKKSDFLEEFMENITGKLREDVLKIVKEENFDDTVDLNLDSLTYALLKQYQKKDKKTSEFKSIFDSFFRDVTAIDFINVAKRENFCLLFRYIEKVAEDENLNPYYYEDSRSQHGILTMLTLVVPDSLYYLDMVVYKKMHDTLGNENYIYKTIRDYFEGKKKTNGFIKEAINEVSKVLFDKEKHATNYLRGELNIDFKKILEPFPKPIAGMIQRLKFSGDFSLYDKLFKIDITNADTFIDTYINPEIIQILTDLDNDNVFLSSNFKKQKRISSLQRNATIPYILMKEQDEEEDPKPYTFTDEQGVEKTILPSTFRPYVGAGKKPYVPEKGPSKLFLERKDLKISKTNLPSTESDNEQQKIKSTIRKKGLIKKGLSKKTKSTIGQKGLRDKLSKILPENVDLSDVRFMEGELVETDENTFKLKRQKYKKYKSIVPFKNFKQVATYESEKDPQDILLIFYKKSQE